jgi:ribosome-associated protein
MSNGITEQDAARVERLLQTTLQALDDMKAVDVRVIDVRGQTSITDLMVVASGTSTRHVKAVADKVEEAARAIGVRPLGVEGQQGAEWILIDLVDVVVHVMLPEVRTFYALEKLWSVGSDDDKAARQD